MRHVRTSERKVRDDIYECLADLEGFGLSAMESMKSLVRVAELFERKWKILDDEEDAFDMDTLPHEGNLRTAARQIEVKGMACVVQVNTCDRFDYKERSWAIFRVWNPHWSKYSVPLPLIPVCGETTDDIAMQCKLLFEILDVVDNVSPEDLYSDTVDSHMTDSTQYNKGFAKVLADMFNLDTVKGQLFCGTHTTLGFSGAMNKILAVVERYDIGGYS